MKAILCVAGLVGLLTTPNLFASMNITMMDNTSSYSYGDGGEFRAVGDVGLNAVVDWSAYAATTQGTVTSATDGSSWGYQSWMPGDRYFQTFCTELYEDYYPGVTYPVTSLGNSALYDNTGHPVPITKGVAYLYSQFAAGTLSGYDYVYGSGRSATAGDLQNAIWTLLGEQSTALASWVAADLSSALGSTANWTKAANGAYGVEDMTLNAPGQAQDQLVVAVPETTTVIAGLLLLLPFGASALRILRRNRAA
jgi:hypothetical protein